jgi:hypothetical protein
MEGVCLLALTCTVPATARLASHRQDQQLWQTVSPKIPKVRASLAAMTTTGFGYGSRPVYLDRAIYTTITVMSVLIVYDGWQNLKFGAPSG